MTLSHPIAALAIQALIGALTGNWWAGAASGAAFFIGREITQAEYRWIDTYGLGLRANMPWWAAFDPRVWRKFDAWADWLAPVVVVCLMVFLTGVL